VLQQFAEGNPEALAVHTLLWYFTPSSFWKKIRLSSVSKEWGKILIPFKQKY
jgi:hypothetical protein